MGDIIQALCQTDKKICKVNWKKGVKMWLKIPQLFE